MKSMLISRTLRRTFTALALGAALLAVAPGNHAAAQNGKAAGEGFFELEQRESDPNKGAIYGYFFVMLIGGLALFMIGKSSHREVLK